MKRLWLGFLALCFFTLKTQAQAKWNCGENGAANVVAVFDGATQTLTISGTGKMGEGSPWGNLKYAIKIVKINQGVTSIGKEAFGRGFFEEVGYRNLETVIIANTVTRINESAFAGAVNLRKINIPNSVKIIEAWAFGECGLESISLPNSINYIFTNAFINCKSLKTANLSKTQIKDIDFFGGCELLEEVYLPKTVESIYNKAFYGCNSLKFITCHNQTPPKVLTMDLTLSQNILILSRDTLNKYIFFDLSQLTLYVPQASIIIYKYADFWKDFGKIEAIPLH